MYTNAQVVLRQVLIVVGGVALAAAMVLLGVWQLDVYHEQGAAASARRAAAPPVPLSEAAPPGEAVTDGFGRSVTFAGTYDPTLQELVPPLGGSPGVRVLTGLRQPDGSVVQVVRGLLAAGSTSAPAPPAGPVEQTGILLPSEDSGDDGTPGTPASVRLPVLAQEWPGPLVGGFVTLSPPDAAAQGLAASPLQLPESGGRLRNGAYAIQWWLFSAFAVVMAIRMARDFGRRDADTTSDDPMGAVPSETHVTEVDTEAPVEPT